MVPITFQPVTPFSSPVGVIRGRESNEVEEVCKIPSSGGSNHLWLNQEHRFKLPAQSAVQPSSMLPDTRLEARKEMPTKAASGQKHKYHLSQRHGDVNKMVSKERCFSSVTDWISWPLVFKIIFRVKQRVSSWMELSQIFVICQKEYLRVTF